MQRTFDELGIELLKWGFHRVAFFECYCPAHGTFRFAVTPETEISERHPCPDCDVLRPASGFIAIGYSRRALPFYERVYGAPARMPAARIKARAGLRLWHAVRNSARGHRSRP